MVQWALPRMNEALGSKLSTTGKRERETDFQAMLLLLLTSDSRL